MRQGPSGAGRWREDTCACSYCSYRVIHPNCLERRDGGSFVTPCEEALPVELHEMNSAGMTFPGDAGTGLLRCAMCRSYAVLRRARNAASKPVPSSIMVAGSGTALMSP